LGFGPGVGDGDGMGFGAGLGVGLGVGLGFFFGVRFDVGRVAGAPEPIRPPPAAALPGADEMSDSEDVG
jgi:hypothetical protein